MRLSAIRRLMSRAVVRVAMLKSVVFILRMGRPHIVRRADNMSPRALCQEFFQGVQDEQLRLTIKSPPALERRGRALPVESDRPFWSRAITPAGARQKPLD